MNWSPLIILWASCSLQGALSHHYSPGWGSKPSGSYKPGWGSKPSGSYKPGWGSKPGWSNKPGWTSKPSGGFYPSSGSSSGSYRPSKNFFNYGPLGETGGSQSFPPTKPNMLSEYSYKNTNGYSSSYQHVKIQHNMNYKPQKPWPTYPPMTTPKPMPTYPPMTTPSPTTTTTTTLSTTMPTTTTKTTTTTTTTTTTSTTTATSTTPATTTTTTQPATPDSIDIDLPETFPFPNPLEDIDIGVGPGAIFRPDVVRQSGNSFQIFPQFFLRSPADGRFSPYNFIPSYNYPYLTNNL